MQESIDAVYSWSGVVESWAVGAWSNAGKGILLHSGSESPLQGTGVQTSWIPKSTCLSDLVGCKWDVLLAAR